MMISSAFHLVGVSSFFRQSNQVRNVGRKMRGEERRGERSETEDEKKLNGTETS